MAGAAPLKVAVLMGGTGPEREVSLRSGEGIFHAVKAAGYLVEKLDVVSPEDPRITLDRMELAFLAFHGDFGENGTMQQVLEARGIPYTGSGPRASRLAMDKWESKRIFESAGLVTPDARRLEGSGAALDGLMAWVRTKKDGVIAKPVYGGSSCGVEMMRQDDAHTRACMRRCLARREPYMLEEFIHGRELTAGVLDDVVLPIIELILPGEIYDYDAKYLRSDTRYVFPEFSGQARQALRAAAQTAFTVLGCKGYARVDFIQSRDALYLLEVNTLPGMTPRSLLPKAAEKAGLAYDALCAKMLSLALEP